MQSSEQKQMNPWTELWIKPRQTIRYLIDTHPTRVILWLAILMGALAALTGISGLWVKYPDRTALYKGFFIAAILVVGAGLGLLHLYIGSWLYTLTGSWIGGKGSFTDVKCAIGWGNYPSLVSLALSFLQYLFLSSFWLSFILGALSLISLVWGVIIFFNILGEAHRFSAWKGVAAALIAMLLVFVALSLISLLVPLLSPLFTT